MQINVSFDNSVANAPGGLSANGAFESAVDYVANLYDRTFTANVTITIDVGWGEIGGGAMDSGALGESQGQFLGSNYYPSYSSVAQALISEGAPGASSLPSSNPGGTLQMVSAEEKALGVYNGPATSAANPDGWVGFGTNFSYDFTPNATPASYQYYFTGVVEHEFSEVMGRVSYLDTPGYESLMDLFRYSGNGSRQTSPYGTGYFSTNNGATPLDYWNNYNIAGGDLGDWASSAGNDAFDAFSNPGVINSLTQTDVTLMDALGWGAPVQTPPVVTVTNATPSVQKNQSIALSSLYSIRDPDGDQVTQYQVWFVSSTGSQVTLFGNPIAQNQAVTVSSLASLTYTGDATAGTDHLWVQAYDGTSWSGWSGSEVFINNVGEQAPVVTAANATPKVQKNQPVTLSSLYTASDPDPYDPITQYQVWFVSATGNTVMQNGVPIAQNQPVTVSTLYGLVYTGGATAGTDHLWVQASDGLDWGGWSGSEVYLNAVGEQAPLVTQAASAMPTVQKNQQVALSSLYTSGGPDPYDPITQYQVWFDSSTGSTVKLNGTPIVTDQPVTVPNLYGLIYTGNATAGTDRLWVQATDGVQWGGWAGSEIFLNNVGEQAPVVTATNQTQRVQKNQALSLGNLYSASDPDPYDPVTAYQVWFVSNSGSAVYQNGVAIPTNQPVTVQSLYGLSYAGSATAGTDMLWVQATDGVSWSGWGGSEVFFNSVGEQAPVVTVTNPPPTVQKYQPIALSSLYSAHDPDLADPVTSYQVWFVSSTGGTVSYFGTPIPTNQAVTESGLYGLTYTAGAVAGTDRLWVQATDGTAWSGWGGTEVFLNDVGEQAPVVTLTNATPTVQKNQGLTLSTLYSASDPDPYDPVTSYQVWFVSNTGSTVYQNGAPIATNQPVTVSNLYSLSYLGGATAGTDMLWVQATDGVQWSGWGGSEAFINNLGARAPIVTVLNAEPTLQRNQSISLSSLYSASEPDPYDSVAQYQVWFVSSTGNQVLQNGIPIATNQPVTVSNLYGLTYTGGATAGTDRLWVQATDGTVWSGWGGSEVFLNDVGEQAPKVTPIYATPTVVRYQSEYLSSLYSTTQPDPYVPIAAYQVWFVDSTGGSVTQNGSPIATNQAVQVSNLNSLIYSAGATAGTDKLWVQAWDGVQWSGWGGSEVFINDVGATAATAASALPQPTSSAAGFTLDGQANNLVAAMATHAASQLGADQTTVAIQALNDPSLQGMIAAASHH